VFSPRALTSPSRDKYAAHELAHHILRHDLPSMRTPEEKEHQANIEAVRILVVANGVTEEQALRVVLGHLKGRTGTATGHASPCEEIRVVSAAFPAQRGWSAALECR
jgi:hypothetical protein